MNTYKKIQEKSIISDMEQIKDKVRDTLIALTLGAMFTAGSIAIFDHFAISANASDIKRVDKKIDELRVDLKNDITEIKESQNRLLNLHIQQNLN